MNAPKSKKQPVNAVVTPDDIVDDLVGLINAGLMERVERPDGQTGFQLTAKGQEYIENKFPQLKGDLP